MITANEGDARDYVGFAEEVRVGALDLDNTLFPNETFLKNNDNLGRLTVTSTLGNDGGDLDYERLYAFGARSFSMWNAAGQLVFDSGSDLEVITAALSPLSFNSDGTAASFDTRSDNKGPEPEAVTIGLVNSKPYAFIAMERIGGIMVFDVSQPAAPKFVQYINSAPTDIAPEGLIFISAADSPIGRPLVLAANEVSGTVSLFQLMEANLVFNAPAGAAANDMTLRKNGLDLELIDNSNGSVLLRQPFEQTNSLTILGVNGEVETLTVDFAFGGAFALPGGVAFNAGTGTGDTLKFTGTTGVDSIIVQDTQASFNSGLTVSWSGLESLQLNSANGNDLFRVTGQPLSSGIVDLAGGADNDIYVLGTTGTRVRITDSAGVDTLDFTPATHGITVNLSLSTGQVQNVDTIGNQVQLVGTFEHAIGSSLNDNLTGNASANNLWGMGGNDVLAGGGGNDYLDGGEGDDSLSGDTGDDILLGRAGADLIYGGAGRDLLIGGTQADRLFGDAGDEILIGGSTVYDDDRAMLDAILALWNSSLPYSKRMQNLKHGLLAKDNLLDDGLPNFLFGDSDHDMLLH